MAKDILGTFISDLVLQVLSYFSQVERENIHQRQAEGIAAAKARGVRFGREKKTLPSDFDELYTAWRQGEITPEELELRCGMALAVVYRKIKEECGPEYQVRHYRKRSQKG